MLITILVFIITLVILVVIHELGHFLVAKKSNIKVLEFGFGIPPKIFGKKWGETLISLNWLPFGGFVRLLGEDEVDQKILDNKRSFAAQTVSTRIAVVVAGVVMNLVLAWLLFYIVIAAQNFKVQLPLLSDHKFIGVNQTNEKFILIGEVIKDSPAELAGIKKGDRVVSIDGQPLEEAGELIDKTKEKTGQEISLNLTNLQNSETRIVKLTPRENPPQNQGALGISLGTFQIANLNYSENWQKLLAGPIHGLNLIIYSGEILGKTISIAINTKDINPVSQNIAGPVGITAIVGQILSIQNPLIPYLDFVAALSLNLALVNILPFPGLDGGRLLFLGIEALTRKKVHANIEKYVHTIGLVLLLSLILLVTISDIKKFLP